MRRQQGTTLVLTALMLSALLGIAALAVDQGVLFLARQRAQDIADAAALAGGSLLPDAAGATAAAAQIIAVNNHEGGLFLLTGLTTPTQVTRDDGTALTVSVGDALEVQGETDAPVAFGQAVGFVPQSQSGAPDRLSVPAEAAVVVQNACGLPAGVGLAPFGLIGDEPSSTDPTVRYVAALLSTATGTQTPSAGAYQPITRFGGQPIVLRQNIWSHGKLVAQGNFDPLLLEGNQGYAAGINHRCDAPLAAGQTLSPDSSATLRLTQTYLAARLSASNTQFTHTYSATPAYMNWFFGASSLPLDLSKSPVADPNTGQTYFYHQDPHRQELTDAHLLLLPIISQSVKDGTEPVTVLAFAAFFVEQPYLPSNTNNAIAQGRFIGLFLPGANGGACTGAGVDTPAELVR